MGRVGSSEVIRFVAGHSFIYIYHTISNEHLVLACDVTRSKWMLDVSPVNLLSVFTLKQLLRMNTVDILSGPYR